jgi:hypothetical protein
MRCTACRPRVYSARTTVTTCVTVRLAGLAMQYGDPAVRRAVPLALAMVHVSDPAYSIVDTLSKLTHDMDVNTAMSAIMALGIIGAGTNNSRIAGLLRQLTVFYDKEASPLFVTRLAQVRSECDALAPHWHLICGVVVCPQCVCAGYSAHGQGSADHPPVPRPPHAAVWCCHGGLAASDCILPRLSGALSLWCCHCAILAFAGVVATSSPTPLPTLPPSDDGAGQAPLPAVLPLHRHVSAVFGHAGRVAQAAARQRARRPGGTLASALSARARCRGVVCGLCVSLCAVSVCRSVRASLGDPAARARAAPQVDTVGQIGRPKTITGFQTHTTPVLIGTKDRAELASDEYEALSSVLEGFVILRKKAPSAAAAGVGAGAGAGSSVAMEP